MSRGRKAKTNSTSSEWEQIFDKSRGVYFQYLITELGKENKKLSDENANELLEKIRQEKKNLLSKRKSK
jgi:fructosamine-3-kinase